MRYVGQGHDLTVRIPAAAFDRGAPELLRELYEAEYERVFGITIPGMRVEITSWALRMAAVTPPPEPCPPMPACSATAKPAGERLMFDARTGQRRPVPLYWRFELAPGVAIPGPAIIAEEETSTLVTAGFTASINALGYIVMQRKTGADQ
jgi:N-methylhydantoinase A